MISKTVACAEKLLTGVETLNLCVQDNKADVILKYNAEEARSLKAYGELPEHGEHAQPPPPPPPGGRRERESLARSLTPFVFLTAKIDEWHAGEEDEIQFDDNGVDDEGADDVRVQEFF